MGRKHNGNAVLFTDPVVNWERAGDAGPRTISDLTYDVFGLLHLVLYGREMFPLFMCYMNKHRYQNKIY
jgi:hypothetical protein